MAKDAGKHKFRMHIEYPDGTVHKGKKDFRYCDSAYWNKVWQNTKFDPSK